MNHKQYAVYKGEELLAMGTRKECADKLGVKQDTITWYGTPTSIKRAKGSTNRRVLVKLGKDEDYDDGLLS